MKRASAAAVAATLALLAGCGSTRGDRPGQVAIVETVVGAHGSLFLRYDASAATDDEGRWIRGAAGRRGWIEVATATSQTPPGEDPVLHEPTWAAALLHDDDALEWRPFPLIVVTAAIGPVRDEMLPSPVLVDAAPASWADILETRLAADSDLARARVDRFAAVDWRFVLDLPAEHDARPVAWLRGDAPCAPSDADAVLAREVVRDGWRTERLLRIPIALLAPGLALSRSGDVVVGTRRVTWLARFARASGDVRATVGPGQPLILASRSHLHGSDEGAGVSAADVAHALAGAAQATVEAGVDAAAVAGVAYVLLEPFVELASVVAGKK